TQCVSWDRVGTARPYRQAEEAHSDLVLRQSDAGRVRAARYKAVLDGNGGAGGPMGLRVLQALAVETTAVHCEPDGLFRHEPEPTAENLKDVCPQVKKAGADIGFALDPDSD